MNINDVQIFPYDIQYYQELLEKQNYDIDKNKLREYLYSWLFVNLIEL